MRSWYFCAMMQHFFRLSSISKRLFFSFGIMLLCLLLVGAFAVFFQSKINTIHSINASIDQQRILMVILSEQDLDFLRFETVNEDFFLTDSSGLLDMRKKVVDSLIRQYTSLQKAMLDHELCSKEHFAAVEKIFGAYQNTFDSLSAQIRLRGFKDHGVEGSMRNYAHELENKNARIPLEQLLMLRRHEKDFFLRKEARYITQFNNLADRIAAQLPAEHPNSLTLAKYQEQFNALVQMDYAIGIRPDLGMLGRLNTHTEALSRELLVLNDMLKARTDTMVKNITWLFGGIVLLTLLASVLSIYYTSIMLARPIKKLTGTMTKFIVKEGLNENEWEEEMDTYEVNQLTQSFITMSRKLKNQFMEIERAASLTESQNKELKKLNEELDRFIYSAAHDLKSPLASLLGLIHLAKMEINQAEHAHYFDKMNHTVNKLDSFIRDITDYAKNKRQRLKIEEVDLALIISNILADLQYLPQAHRIEPLLRIKGSGLHTDRTRLEIILKNLFSNAYRYYDKHKKNNYLFIEAIIDENALRFEIKDNGIGIGQEHLSHIFDMFYRAVDSAHGTGIGLFLVKESVKMCEGTIRVESSLGQWTRFNMVLPNHAKQEKSEKQVEVHQEAIVFG